MDLWVVAAAAGAGYLAKNLQNLPSSEKERLVEITEPSSKFSTNTSLESRNLLQQIRDKTCPLRRLSRKKALRDASSQQKDEFDRRFLDLEQLGSSSCDPHSGPRMASATGSSGVNVVKEDYDVLWLSRFPPGFGRESISQDIEFADAECSPFEFGKFKLLQSLPSGYFIKPFSPVQSDLATRLCKEHEKMEQFVFNSFSSHCIPTKMPLMISEGTEIISRSNSIPFDIWSNGSSKDTVKSDAGWNEKMALSSDPSFGNTNLFGLHGWKSCSTKRICGSASDLPGSPNLMLLFMIGITIGFLSTIIANQKKVTSLNEQLKQANCLVQDLTEELEMKDKLTVKDLADEDSQSLSINDSYVFNQELIPSASGTQPNEPEAGEVDGYGTKLATARTTEGPMLRSEIEAELEAELERLELNIKTSVLESDRTSGSSETPPPNYAVSPRELAISLHELKELRLEERIKELETAIQISQDRLQYLESEYITSLDITSAPESPASV